MHSSRRQFRSAKVAIEHGALQRPILRVTSRVYPDSPCERKTRRQYGQQIAIANLRDRHRKFWRLCSKEPSADLKLAQT